MNLFKTLMAKLAGEKGPRIMPGVTGELLAKIGLTQIGPHRYDHHVFVNAYRRCPKIQVFDTPYGPAGMTTKRAKKVIDDKARAARGRFVGPFPTHGKLNG